MIVRVQGEGQYRLSTEAVAGLNAIDVELLQAIHNKDQVAVPALLEKMIGFVHSEGQPLGYDEIVPSDTILPPDSLSYDEIVGLLQEDGLVPG
jgi:hypothetical protein